MILVGFDSKESELRSIGHYDKYSQEQTKINQSVSQREEHSRNNGRSGRTRDIRELMAQHGLGRWELRPSYQLRDGKRAGLMVLRPLWGRLGACGKVNGVVVDGGFPIWQSRRGGQRVDSGCTFWSGLS